MFDTVATHEEQLIGTNGGGSDSADFSVWKTGVPALPTPQLASCTAKKDPIVNSLWTYFVTIELDLYPC